MVWMDGYLTLAAKASQASAMRREKGGKEQPFNKEEKQQHHQSKQEHSTGPLWPMGEKEKVGEELNDGEEPRSEHNTSTTQRGETSLRSALGSGNGDH